MPAASWTWCSAEAAEAASMRDQRVVRRRIRSCAASRSPPPRKSISASSAWTRLPGRSARRSRSGSLAAGSSTGKSGTTARWSAATSSSGEVAGEVASVFGPPGSSRVRVRPVGRRARVRLRRCPLSRPDSGCVRFLFPTRSLVYLSAAALALPLRGRRGRPYSTTASERCGTRSGGRTTAVSPPRRYVDVPRLTAAAGTSIRSGRRRQRRPPVGTLVLLTAHTRATPHVVDSKGRPLLRSLVDGTATTQRSTAPRSTRPDQATHP